MNRIYVNGSLVDENKASIPVFDRGFSYGDGLFETMRACDGRPVFLKEHLERLKKGAAAISIPRAKLKPVESDIENGILSELLEKNGLSEGEAYIKIILTRGVDRGGHLPPKDLDPTTVILTKPLEKKTLEGTRKNGVRAVLVRGYAPALPGIKSLNYLPNILAKLEAGRLKAAEGLFVDHRGRVTEGTSTNLFVVIRGIIRTPPLSGGPFTDKCLPGVTRGAVIKLASGHDIKLQEAPVHEKTLLASEEAFLTNAILGIVPLIRVDKTPIGSGRPGRVTRLLQDFYKPE
ncbi:MAG: aminotransferase class IV [Deltaproteobacteria bacterium]|nr:aminotransferase class IV [Deltaproteobacteria bacterium]